jgi:hypothetical protein
MRKSEIIKKYKKDRHIQDNYKLDEDEMYLIEEIQKALKQGQTLPLVDVSNQRELLIAYELKLWINPTKEQIEISEKIVDMYLSN